jgi:hypothetical protein
MSNTLFKVLKIDGSIKTLRKGKELEIRDDRKSSRK